MFLRIFFQYRLVDLNYVYKMHVILILCKFAFTVRQILLV